MKLAVIGSRVTFDDNRITEAINALPATEILTAGHSQTAAHATWHATLKGLPTRRFETDPEQPANKAKLMRDQQLIEAADALLAFWDGYVGSVSRSIDYARQLQKKVVVIRI